MTPAGLCYPLRPRPDQTLAGYGLQLIAFLIDTRSVETLDDRQLEITAGAVDTAVRLQYPDARVYDTLADVQRLVQATIRRRARYQESRADLQARTLPPDAGLIQRLRSDERPDDGPMAPTHNPRTPMPVGPRAGGIALDRFPDRETAIDW